MQLIRPKHLDDYIKLYYSDDIDVFDLFETINGRIIMSVLDKIIRMKNFNHPLYKLFESKYHKNPIVKQVFQRSVYSNSKYLLRKPNNTLFTNIYGIDHGDIWPQTYHIKNNIMVGQYHNIYNLYGLLYMKKIHNITLTSNMKSFLLKEFSDFDAMCLDIYDTIFWLMPKYIRNNITYNLANNQIYYHKNNYMSICCQQIMNGNTEKCNHYGIRRIIFIFNSDEI